MANGVATTSLFSGVYRVFEAGERLLIDQAELVRLESRERIAFFVTRFGLVGAGLFFLFTAWVAGWIALIVALDAIPLAARIGLAALAQLLVGGGLILAARRTKGDSDAT